MADHKTTHVHGDMSVREHEKTFDGFIRLSTWAAVLAILVVIFLALSNA
ncbi:aa3-type cytochrome c oxidase subunit IV [Paracoccus sp. p4-l81]